MSIKKVLFGASIFFLVLSTFAGFIKDRLIYHNEFDSPESLQGWKGVGKNALNMKSGTLSCKGPIQTSYPLDPDLYRGKEIMLEVILRTKNIIPTERNWQGAKAMMTFTDSKGKVGYQEKGVKRFGSCDWYTVQHTFKNPDDPKNLSIVLGVEATKGVCEYKSVRIYSVRKIKNSGRLPELTERPDTSAIPRGSTDKTRYRGFVISYATEKRFFDKKAKWNVNLVRYQMLANIYRPNGSLSGRYDISTQENYYKWIDEEISKIDDILKICREYGIKVIIDLHTGPAGSKKNEVSSNLIHDPLLVQEQLIAVWRKLARRYKGNPQIYGYDILNEPLMVNFGKGQDNTWEDIAKRVVGTIREIDPETPIIIEPDLHDVRKLFFIDAPNIIYSVHTYAPMAYTHQQIGNYPDQYTYPGEINGVHWDKETLRWDLRHIIEFQKKYNARIYVGEFSAALWAEGREQYFKDLIELFEEYGWDWTYHAFWNWGWPGMSIEHVGTSLKDFKFSKDNPTKQVLLNALLKNTEIK